MKLDASHFLKKVPNDDIRKWAVISKSLIHKIFFALTGDPFRFLTNYPPFKWAQKLPPCDCFRSMYKAGPIRWLLSKVMGSTLLFNDRLRNKKAIFLPNQSKKEQSSLPGPDGSRDQG